MLPSEYAKVRRFFVCNYVRFAGYILEKLGGNLGICVEASSNGVIVIDRSICYRSDAHKQLIGITVHVNCVPYIAER
jgi:hypothetical protein